MPGAVPSAVAIANRIDVFDCWSLALIAYGFSRVSGLRWWASCCVVAVLWCGSEALSIRLQAMGAS